MGHRLQRILVLSLGLALGGLSLAACDLSGSAEDPKHFIDLTLTREDAQGHERAIDSFSVPLTDELPLRNAVKAPVSLKGYRGAQRYARIGGDPDKSVVAFLLTFDGRIGGERLHGGPVVAGVREDSLTGVPPTGSDVEGTFRGTYYGFFVEGIGDRPEAPLEVVLRGTEDTQKITIDPDRHTLPARYALHLNEKDLGLSSPASGDKASEVSWLEAEFGGVPLGRPKSDGLETRGPPYPIHLFHLPNSGTHGRTLGGPVFPEKSSAISYHPPLRDADFYLFYLGE